MMKNAGAKLETPNSREKLKLHASLPKKSRGIERARTIPEQIADRVAVGIVSGEYRGGEHIPEQELAAMFGVSHAPVREALRELGKRGLVEFLPRRGAYAINVTLDAIADIFNIRAVLLGLAAHGLAQRPDREIACAELLANASALKELAEKRNVDPLTFAHAAGRTGAAIYRNCGNILLLRTLLEQNRGSLWALMWKERTLDFLTYERRRDAAADWNAVAKAAVAGNGVRAERIVRKALFESRDSAMVTLRKLRGEDVQVSKFIRD